MEKPHKKTDVLNKKDSSRLTLYGSRGFTLIEVIMVIILMGIIGSTAAMIIFQGARSYGEEEVRKDLTTQGRFAIERMAREIRLIGCNVAGNNCIPSATYITTMGLTELRFININIEGKGFRLDGSGNITLCRNQTVCAGNEDILANNVSALTLEYCKQGETSPACTASNTDVWTIIANLTLTRDNQSVNFRIQVHPRAFKW
ncbi:MAG: type II secretion system protein [Deltaproteobacteria bacterium]|nr:type II secretion system protein [Deltaproteobacteria bacterium]